jgi:hypothetical protein
MHHFLTLLRYATAYKKLLPLPSAPFTRNYSVLLFNAPCGRYNNPPFLHWAQPLMPRATAQKRF